MKKIWKKNSLSWGYFILFYGWSSFLSNKHCWWRAGRNQWLLPCHNDKSQPSIGRFLFLPNIIITIGGESWPESKLLPCHNDKSQALPFLFQTLHLFLFNPVQRSNVFQKNVFSLCSKSSKVKMTECKLLYIIYIWEKWKVIVFVAL